MSVQHDTGAVDPDDDCQPTMPSDGTVPTDPQVRALKPDEHLLVYPDDPAAPLDGEVAVYSGGTRYLVNLAAAFCTCKWAQFNPEKECKHAARARYERDGLPWWADGDAVCEMFRAVWGGRDE
jgi:hypothetical protein